jgi:hypothetical protein
LIRPSSSSQLYLDSLEGSWNTKVMKNSKRFIQSILALSATGAFIFAFQNCASGGGGSAGGPGVSGTPGWNGTRQLGVALAQTNARGVVADSTGNIYVTGYTTGNLDGTTLTGQVDLIVTKYDSLGIKQWTSHLGGAFLNTYGSGITIDTAGDLYVTGDTNGSLDGQAFVGSTDLFVVKYDPNGVKQWTKEMGAVGSQIPGKAIASDSLNNVYVTGSTNGNFDGTTKLGAQDFYLTKFDSSGTKLWTRDFGLATKVTDTYGVTTDSNDNVYVVGYTTGGLDGNVLTGGTDFFVTKYNSSGTRQWTRQLGVATKTTVGSGVAIDSSGSIYVTGYTYGGLDGNSLTGSSDSFLTKYDSAAVKQWTKQLGTIGADTTSTGIAIDALDNVFISGYTGGGLDVNSLNGLRDFFVTKYTSAGSKLWTRQLGAATTLTYARGVEVDSSLNAFVAGATSGGLDGNTLAGSTDLFITKYDPNGVKQ